MNLLLNTFPIQAEISGRIIPINWGYRASIDIMLVWEDKLLTNQEKAYLTVALLYDCEMDEIPDYEVAFKKALLFLDLGEEPEEIQTVKTKPKPRVYSFEKDHKYIFTAIDHVLDGRLSKGEEIHWWEFAMAFMEIPESCTLSRIIDLRNKKNKGKLSKEEKAIYLEMIDIMELEPPQESLLNEEEQKNAERFIKLLEKGNKK